MHAWLENQIGQSAANIITSLVVLIIVIAAIAITISLLRKFNNGTFVVGGKSRTPRLSVRDAAAVDRTRRLVLVRRDNVEHLLMIGGPTDIVIETNIKIGEPAARNENPAIAEMNSARDARPTSSYREPTLTKPSSSANNGPISPSRPISSDRRHTTDYSTVKINPSSDELNVAPTPDSARRAPEFNNYSSTDVALNPNLQSPLSAPKEPSIGDFAPTKDDRMSLRPAPKQYISPDIRPTLKDSAVSAEIEGRREPAINEPLKNTDTSSVNLDDDFDHMFENELSDAIKNEKIKP